MKKSGVALIIFLVLLIAVGWIAQLTGAVGREQERSSYLKQAAQYVEENLFQKAIDCYNNALELKETLKTRTMWLSAFKDAYLDGDISLSSYSDALSEMCELYPEEVSNWEELISIYLGEGDMNSAYNCYESSLEAGVTSDAIQGFANQILYAFSLTGRSYSDFARNTDESYTVFNGSSWGVVDASGSTLYDCDYDYISPYGENAYALFVTENGQRILDTKSVVQAKLDITFEKTGAYADGLLPICAKDGKWSYLDCSANTVVLGTYENASNFENGIAAVCQNGTWSLINTKGETVSATSFSDIKLHSNGAYTYDGVMIAAVNGKYGMYDAEGKASNTFVAEDMDIYMGGNIAYCDGSGKWGYVSAKGTVTIAAQYDNAKSFSNGLGAVCIDDAWGFVNTSGEQAIECRFLDADYLTSAGTCMVSAAAGQYNMMKLKYFNK